MTSLLSVPVLQPHKLNTGQPDLTANNEIANIFKPDLNSWMTGKDKLHQWAMWRTNVNHSFIRNLPVQSRSGQPYDETTVREKRIDIDRFLLYSDTDELKRLQMKENYGSSPPFTSRLGESSYFLYGLPRIFIRQEPEEYQPQRASSEISSSAPSTPPRKPHLFVGAGQIVRNLSDRELKPIELSHAQKIKYGQTVVTEEPRNMEPVETEQLYDVWEKTFLIKDKYDDMSVHNFRWDGEIESTIGDSSVEIEQHSFIPVKMNGK